MDRKRAIVMGVTSGIGYQNLQLDLDKELRTVATNALGFTRMANVAFEYFVHTPLLSDGGTYPMLLDAHQVAELIVRGIERNSSIITVDWKYRVLVFFWQLIPHWLWVRMRIVSSAGR